jgi:pilus assembly protein TadC
MRLNLKETLMLLPLFIVLLVWLPISLFYLARQLRLPSQELLAISKHLTEFNQYLSALYPRPDPFWKPRQK